jgi:hypothetical protein
MGHRRKMTAAGQGHDIFGEFVMTSALLERPVAAPRQEAELRVRRADIVFRNVEPGRVRLSIKVSNVGETRSEPTPMVVQAAPLGAFVGWKDVTALLVPPIEPDSYVEVSADLTAPSPTRRLGDFARVPPRKLLTAVAGNDDSEERSTTGGMVGQLFARLLGRTAESQPAQQLPDDPLQLLSRESVYWAGNINVLIGSKAVERHLAQALRIYPGKTNLAIFFVGDRRDEYQFALSGSGAGWNAALFDATDFPSLIMGRSSGRAIPQFEWILMDGCRVVVLAVCPPQWCTSGSIEVQVRQRRTGKSAAVEFSLDASAAGAGCYTV